jgi:hypothetical protein
LASASGHSISVINRGEFDTVSPVAAVDRLAEGRWWGSPGPAYYNYDQIVGIALDSPVARDDGSVTPEEELGEEPDGEPVPLPEPELPLEPDVPAEPEVPEEPEVVQLTVVSSEATLLLVWDAQGGAWLVPGYVMRYSDDQWGWVSVISLIEGVIQIPEPIPVGIMPVPEPYLE